jgi:outer membrane protein assembly factor BamB
MLKFHSSVIFLSLIFGCVFAQAAIVWEHPEEFEHRYRPLVSIARQASDGKIWLFTGRNESKSYGAMYIERIDPITGAVINSAQIVSNTTNFSGSFGNFFDTQGGAFIDGYHYDATLNRKELAKGIAHPLPQGRWAHDAFSFEVQDVVIRGPGVLDKRPISGAPTNSRSIVSHPLFGLWKVTPSYLDAESVSPIDIVTGRPGNSISIDNSCRGEIQILSPVRALTTGSSRSCLIDLQTGAVVTNSSMGWPRFLIATSDHLAISATENNASTELAAFDVQTGSLIWTKELNHAFSVKIIDNAVVVEGSQKIIALNRVDSTTIFQINEPRLLRFNTSISPNGVLLNFGSSVDLYSAQDGSFLRTVLPSEINAVPDESFIASANGSVFTASIFEENGIEISQVTKRDATTGKFLWRTTIAHEVSAAPAVGMAPVLWGVPSLRVRANTLLLTWGHLRRKENRTTILAFAADSGELNFSSRNILVGSFTSSPSDAVGKIAYARLTELGNILLESREYLAAPYQVSIQKQLLNPLGQFIRNYDGVALPSGDLLSWNTTTISRIRETDGQVLWAIPNPTSSFTLNALYTPQEMIFPVGTPWTAGISVPRFRRIDLSSGIHVDTSYDFPLGYDASNANQFNAAIGSSSTAVSGTPAFFSFTSSTGLPPILLFATAPAPIRPNFPSLPKPLQFFATPKARIRGWVFDAEVPLRGFVWTAEPTNNFQAFINWSNGGTPRFGGAKRNLYAQFLENLADSVYAIDQVFDGTRYSYHVRKSTPRINLPDVSLQLSEVPQVPARVGYHSLRVTNIGSTEVRRAQLQSMNFDSMRFSCSATNGSCSQASGEGTLYLELNLNAGGSANIELFDNDFSRGNGVVLMSPLGTSEADITNNAIEFDRAYLIDGFEAN